MIERMKRRPLVAFAAAGALALALAVAALVSALGEGKRACFAGDPRLPAPIADAALTAGVPELRGTTPVAIELVQGRPVPPGRKVAVAAGALVGITGWAIDPGAKRAASVVLARVDGGPAVRADTCFDRSDVAKALNMPAYARSGYRLRLGVPPGVHRVVLFVLGAGGKQLYRNPLEVELDVAGTAGARPAAHSVDGGISRLDDAPIDPNVVAGAPFSHPVGTDLRIAGWMIGGTRAEPERLAAVDVLIDGRPVDRAAYGGYRPESANLPVLRNADFTARILTDGMRPGRHEVTLRATVSDGSRIMLPGRIVLDLERAAGDASGRAIGASSERVLPRR
jgi:hypothetical protein